MSETDLERFWSELIGHMSVEEMERFAVELNKHRRVGPSDPMRPPISLDEVVEMVAQFDDAYSSSKKLNDALKK